MARAGAHAIALLVSACAPAGLPTRTQAPEHSAISGTPFSSSPSATAVVAEPSASPGNRCGDSRGTSKEPPYAFPKIAIPLGSDACWDIGPLANPQILSLTNDGSLVAFNARDLEHERDLWYGDLRTGAVKIAYVAPETPGAKVDIWWPQLAGGHLLWLEYVHDGEDADHPIEAWALKDMDLATGVVKVIAHDKMPSYGGHMFAERIRFDGQRIGLLEAPATGNWQIEIRNLAGNVQSTIPIKGDPFDFALVSDGVLYTTGTNDPARDAVSHMHFWHWTPAAGSREIAADVYYVNGEGNLAAWMVDPEASQLTTGAFYDQRIYAAAAPFTAGTAISPEVTANRTMGIDGMACGSGSVVWWERENDNTAPRSVLTLWQPGWSSPIQVDTEGNESYFVSVRGGWLVWMEESGRETLPLMERVRGVPLSTLVTQRPG